MNRILTSLTLLLLIGASADAASTKSTVPELKLPPRQITTPVPSMTKKPAQALPARATPVATRQPTARPTPAPTPTPEIAPPHVAIMLERVTAVRGRRFGANAPAQSGLWDPRMIYQFRIGIPQGWRLMSVDDGTIKKILDKRGQIVRPRPAVGAQGAIGSAGQAIALDLKPEYAILEFTSDLPPRQDDKLGLINATFSLTVGLPQSLRFDNIRSKGGNLLPKDRFPDVVLAIDEVGDDSISIAAFGDYAKFGAFTFIGPDGKALEPFTTEHTTSNPEPGHPAGSLWRYTFTTLPKPVSMEAQYYPLRRRALYTFEEANVPLP
ncbi:MAG: hypothetical protein ABFD69_16865 [Candidatus Sumerlaeia bacterium]